jgi:hypothetical protein
LVVKRDTQLNEKNIFEMDAAETNDLFGAKGRVGEDHGVIYGILGMMLLKGEEHLAVIT